MWSTLIQEILQNDWVQVKQGLDKIDNTMSLMLQPICRLQLGKEKEVLMAYNLVRKIISIIFPKCYLMANFSMRYHRETKFLREIIKIVGTGSHMGLNQKLMQANWFM